MSLTPIEIHNKQFSRSFRGFNEDEVNDFLNQIIADYEQFIKQNDQLKRELAEKTEAINKFKNIHESVNEAFTSAQEASQSLKKRATEEANFILREAEKNADEIVNTALVKSNQLTKDNEKLQKQIEASRNRFISFAESQIKQFVNSEWGSFETEGIMLDEPIIDEPISNLLVNRVGTNHSMDNMINSNVTEGNVAATVDNIERNSSDDHIFDELMLEYEKNNKVDTKVVPENRFSSNFDKKEVTPEEQTLSDLIARMNEGLSAVSDTVTEKDVNKVGDGMQNTPDEMLSKVMSQYDPEKSNNEPKAVEKKELRFRMKRRFKE